MLLLGGAAVAAPFVPRFAVAQADNRPRITIAVQKIVNSNVLDVLREQSNVGERVFYTSLWESLIGRDWLGNLAPRPGLATEWRRVNDQTVELKLRQGVKFHNGDEMTAEDVVFTFSRERMFANTEAKNRSTIRAFEQIRPRAPARSFPGCRGDGPPHLAGPAAHRHRRPLHRALHQRDAGRDPRRAPVPLRLGHHEPPRLGRGGELSRLGRKPITHGPYKVVEFRPDVSLTLEAHDEYWGGRPPLKSIRFVEVPEVASRVAGCSPASISSPATSRRTRSARSRRTPPSRSRAARSRTTDSPSSTRTTPSSPIRWCAAPSPTPSTARRSSRRSGRPHQGAGGSAVGVLRRHVPRDWKVPDYDPKVARDLLRQAGYRGDPIVYRVLNNYYTNQNPTSQILTEMWRSVGLNVQMQTVENWSQIMERGPARAVRDWSNSAPFNDPVSSLVNQHGPNGQQQQIGEWTNTEMNQLCEVLETSTDRISAASRSAHAGNLRARRPRLHGAPPERDLHRQGEGDPLEDRPRLRHGLPSRQLRR